MMQQQRQQRQRQQLPHNWRTTTKAKTIQRTRAKSAGKNYPYAMWARVDRRMLHEQPGATVAHGQGQG